MVPLVLRGLAPALFALLGTCLLPATLHAEIAVTLTESDCRQLGKQFTGDAAAFQPGRDVYGRPVAPAELEDSVSPAFPETITIEIEVELQERFGFPAEPDLYNARALIGEIELRGARTYFRGQPLGENAAAALAARCRSALPESR